MADADANPVPFDGGVFEATGTAYVFTNGNNVTVASGSIDYNDGQRLAR